MTPNDTVLVIPDLWCTSFVLPRVCWPPGGAHPPGTLFPMPWAPLTDALERDGFRVEVWGYGVDRNLDALAGDLHFRLGKEGPVTHVLAHGAGGRIFLEWAFKNPDAWQARVTEGSRALLLGPCTQGSWSLLRHLLKRSGLLAHVAEKPGGNEVVEALLSNPRLLWDLLPQDATPLWPTLKASMPDLPRLPIDRAQSLVLDPAAPIPAVFTILGFATPTAGEPYPSPDEMAPAVPALLPFAEDRGFRQAPGPRPRPVPREWLLKSEPGDGVVTCHNARVPGAMEWFTPQDHGRMLQDPTVMEAVLQILGRGYTDRLPESWARPPEGPGQDLPLEIVPSMDTLDELVVGVGPQEARVRPLQIRVVCGDPPRLNAPVLLSRWKGREQGPLFVAVARGRVLWMELDAGSFTRAGLREGVAAAVADCQSARLYVGLLGVHEQVLTVEESVSAVVEGLILANRAGAGIQQVLFLEPYEDLAVAAARAVVQVGNLVRFPLQGDEVVYPSVRLELAENPRSHANLEPLELGGWQRVTVEGTAGTDLTFTWDSQKAVAQVYSLKGKTRFLDDLVQRIHSSPLDDPETAWDLATHGVPLPLQAPWLARDILLMVDAVSCRIPWEYMGFGDRQDPVRPARDGGLVRRFCKMNVRDFHEPAELKAVVIGDPDPTDPLPSAAAEAQEVAALLRGVGLDVVEKVASPPLDTLRAVDGSAWVLHVAAHGDSQRGVQLGNETWLDGDWIGNLPRVPALVFLSCCDLARVQPAAPGAPFDASPAPESLIGRLFRAGVRAVVAADWAVLDPSGRTFAVTFYQAMLQGRPFGRALQLARKVTFDRHQPSGSWAAWQGYGDPEFRLPVSQPGTRFVSHSEIIDHLVEQVARARQREAVDPAEVAREVERTARFVSRDPVFRRDGRTWEALGDAWAAIGEKVTAVDAYKRALASPSRPALGRALEQRLNLEDRILRDRIDASDGSDAEDLRRQLLVIASEMQQVIQLAGDTSERRSLQAATWKAMARVDASNPHVPEEIIHLDLQACADRYGAARHLARERQERELYPAMNHLTVLWLQGRLPPDAGEDLEDLVQAGLGALEDPQDDSWPFIQVADGLALQWLMGAEDGVLDDALARYTRIRASGADARMWSSVTSQYVFLETLLQRLEPGGERIRRVRRLRQGLPGQA